MSTKRVALKPQEAKIRKWVEDGRSDEWIAHELKTTSPSVQSFRSRNSIYRRDPMRSGLTSEHPAFIEEVDGAILLKTQQLRTSEVFEKEWRPYLRGASEDLRMIVTRSRIYVEKVR